MHRLLRWGKTQLQVCTDHSAGQYGGEGFPCSRATEIQNSLLCQHSIGDQPLHQFGLTWNSMQIPKGICFGEGKLFATSVFLDKKVPGSFAVHVSGMFRRFGEGSDLIQEASLPEFTGSLCD